MPRKRYEKRKDKAGLEKKSPWTRGGGEQSKRYLSTEKRTLIQTMPKQRKDNKKVILSLSFQTFRKNKLFQKVTNEETNKEQKGNRLEKRVRNGN